MLNAKVAAAMIIPASLLLASCGSEPEATADASAMSATEPTPAQPRHYYASIDGDEYLYAHRISEDAKNAGQAATEYTAFRYRGVKNGKITLTSEDMTLTCDLDCKVITVSMPYGPKQRMEYNPDSVAGGAFYDAMNGMLAEYPSRAAAAK
jgi:hypothetical protein